MLTLIFLVIAYQVQNIKWRYSILVLAAINLIFNIYNQTWLIELYAITVVILLFMLNTDFVCWWQKRNARNNPVSFWTFIEETYVIAKANKFRVLSWIIALVISITAVYMFSRYTSYEILGWILGIFIVLYISKKIFFSILPAEWFLHDVDTGYVFSSVLISWGVAYLMSYQLGTQFILPMILAVVLCLIGYNLVHRNTRFLMPGCALILADFIWQIVRYIQSDKGYTPQDITTSVVLMIAMLIGLRWLIKKPGILPIAYLTLIQLFRFAAFVFEAEGFLNVGDFTVPDTTYYILYLVCWMYIAPLLFWFLGLIQYETHLDQEAHTPRVSRKLNELLKKGGES